jgi:hypothetical protein
MNIPKRASRHHAIRASRCSSVSCGTFKGTAVPAGASAGLVWFKKVGVSAAGEAVGEILVSARPAWLATRAPMAMASVVFFIVIGWKGIVS